MVGSSHHLLKGVAQMDIAFDFQIHNVPSREVADEIAADIMAVLAKKHSTEMVVTWEEV